MSAVIVPHEELEPETLRNVIEEFVTRDGTDYGAVEVSLETKVSQVLKQLNSKKAVLVYDNQTETCNILERNHPALNQL